MEDLDRQRLLTRRNTLKLCLPALVGLGTAVGANMVAEQDLLARNRQVRNFKIDGNKSLKQRAAAKGIIFGAAIRHDDLMASPEYAKIIARECGMLVPEWELKWSAGNKNLRPDLQRFDFKPADRLAKFAKQHQIQLRGETLLWHECLPNWFAEQVNRQNAESVLKNHIKTVVGHYAGKFHSWDVVNEAIDLSDKGVGGLRTTPWWQFLGKDYLEFAFRLAHQADPQTLLVYNEYGLDYSQPEDEAKRHAVLKLLQKLQSKGTPIHALGIQEHLAGDRTDFNQQKFREFIRNVASLGLKIMITELDVKDDKLPIDRQERDRIIAGAYEDYLSVALDEKAVTVVTTWGLSDRYTWLSEFSPRPDRAAVRPLPFDLNFKPKLAWNAMARAFDRAPSRKSK
jgi:endo-1,4-beta-xylanase